MLFGSRVIVNFFPFSLSMSFGFSAGDFVAAAKLIKDIVAALHSSSTSEYRELLLELHGLERALYEIESGMRPGRGGDAQCR